MAEELNLIEFPKHKLKEPIPVSIMQIDNHFYATNIEFEICSDGDSAEEAIENFKIYLGNLYEVSKKLVEMVADE